MIFLPWLRKRLEAAGVTFKRIHIQSLADLKGMGQDIVINSTGNRARHLLDVKDQAMEPVRGQTIFVKTGYNKISSQEAR